MIKMFGFIKHMIKFPKFKNQFLFNLFGFIDISDESNLIRTTLMRELIRAQAQFSSKLALICPSEYLDPDDLNIYKKIVPQTRIFTEKIKDKDALNKLIDDEYSIFIFDLKKCLETNMLTEDMYFEYKRRATEYYYNHQEVEQVALIPPIYLRYHTRVRYVTDITGLNDKKYTSEVCQKTIVEKVLNEPDDHKMLDCMHQFYFYDPTADAKEEKKIRKFLHNLLQFEMSINRDVNQHLEKLEIKNEKTTEQSET